MAINAGSIISNTVTRIVDILASGLTDPVSSNRSAFNTKYPKANSRFVVTNYPERGAFFPIVTVEGRKGLDNKLGINSQATAVPITVKVQVWSRSMQQRDNLTDDVYYNLRTIQQSGGTVGTIADGLHDFHVKNEFNIDEPGKTGLHRKVIEFGYVFYT